MDHNKYKDIPVFPLNICLLPGEDLPLKIFEPRYKQLINDSNTNDSTFGIPFVLDQKIQSYGTEVKINQIIAQNSFGEMVIMVEGVSNFKLMELNKNFKDKLYSAGKIIDLKPGGEIIDLKLIKRIILYSDTVNRDFLKEFKSKILRTDDIARILNLNSKDKFQYITMDSQSEKENFIRFNIDTLFKLSEQERLLDSDYSLN